jgi:hypothetical protein
MPFRLIFHPSAEKHERPVTLLNLVVKHGAKVQRSSDRDVFFG